MNRITFILVAACLTATAMAEPVTPDPVKLWPKGTPGAICRPDPRARTKTAKNSRLETAGPPREWLA